MGSVEADRVGVLVVRVWLEQGHPTPFRAVIRSSLDVEREPEVVSGAQTPERVLSDIRAWLEAFRRRA